MLRCCSFSHFVVVVAVSFCFIFAIIAGTPYASAPAALAFRDDVEVETSDRLPLQLRVVSSYPKVLQVSLNLRHVLHHHVVVTRKLKFAFVPYLDRLTIS